MKTTIRLMFAVLGMVALAVVVLIYATTGNETSIAQTNASPTPYHEGFPSPAATQAGAQETTLPLPPAEDQETENSMTNAGIAMIQAGESMEAAAAVMAASGSPTLVDLSGHWYQDARALQTRGAWMIVAATSDSMVHDPDKARELNLASLRANGMIMEMEGQAMEEHGREMIAQVDQLRTDGSLPGAMADDLTERGQDLITTGEQMERDGKQMQEDAETLLQSLGQ